MRFCETCTSVAYENQLNCKERESSPTALKQEVIATFSQPSSELIPRLTLLIRRKGRHSSHTLARAQNATTPTSHSTSTRVNGTPNNHKIIGMAISLE